MSLWHVYFTSTQGDLVVRHHLLNRDLPQLVQKVNHLHVQTDDKTKGCFGKQQEHAYCAGQWGMSHVIDDVGESADMTLLNPLSTVCYHIRLMSIQEMRACVVAKISNRKFIYWYARHIFTCLNNIIAFDRRAGCRAHLRGCNRATIWIVCDTHT